MTAGPERLAAALSDRYRLERELGAGGMATVYLAHDLRHERQVAVKVLRPELAAVIGADRFVAEIKTTAQLQHPHILPLFDSGTADGFLYYVMPYIEGETLRAKLDRETQLGIEEAVRITTQVGDALDYAHRHGVVHRDIKPENILLHDGRPMVADFGIALALSAAAGGRMTETGMSLGTPHYMSPEQATADKEITGRSDIYSLGSVLYEMLAGEPPHIGHSAQQIIMKIIAEPVQSVTKHRRSVPDNVAAAVSKALEKLPADRFGTAREFAEALTNSAFSTVATRSAMSGARSPDRLTAFLPWAAVLVVAAIAAWGWLRHAPPRPVTRYRMGFEPGQEMRQGIAGINVAISPDGRWIVYPGPGGATGQLYLRARDRLDATPIPGTEAGVNPFFSPDGTRIAFFSGANFSLTVVPVAGGPPIQLDKGAPGSAGAGAWGPDGWIYFDTPRGTARIRAEGGTAELLIPYDSAAHEIGFAWTDALPNGKGLVFRARRNLDPNDFDIDAYDLKTRTRHFLMKGIIARYVDPGYLVVVRADGAVLAAPFDQDRLRLTGPAVPLLSGVMVKPLGSADIAISRTGTLMYTPGTGTSSSGYAEAVEVDRHGVITPFTPPFTFSPSLNRAISLSPDGRHLALDQLGTASPDIWVKALPNGALTRLTFDSTGAIRPQWTPDGRDILYLGSVGRRPGDNAVWRRRADGGAPAELVWSDPRWRIRAYSLSRDGRWLVYCVPGANNNRDIWAIHLGHDTIPVPLLTSPSLEDAPTLSPDARWLAYTSDESGREEIYVRPFPNVNDGRWQISVAGGEAPRWSRDGRSLFYQDPNVSLYEARVTTTPTFVNSMPVKVLDGSIGLSASVTVPYYDEMPGGQRFVAVRSATTGPTAGTTQLIVVDNWTTELRARMKGQ